MSREIPTVLIPQQSLALSGEANLSRDIKSNYFTSNDSRDLSNIMQHCEGAVVWTWTGIWLYQWTHFDWRFHPGLGSFHRPPLPLQQQTLRRFFFNNLPTPLQLLLICL